MALGLRLFASGELSLCSFGPVALFYLSSHAFKLLIKIIIPVLEPVLYEINDRGFLLQRYGLDFLCPLKRGRVKILVVVDEAHLLRADVFAELHTLTQFDNDSKNMFAIVLAGQPNLLEKLTYRSSAPLASRVIARTHLSNLNQDQMAVYLEHHLGVAGVKKQLFTEPAVTAIYQGSAGILRKANLLARGSLVAAATEKESSVSAEHVRLASTELM
ncbi:MAG: AAA family ATPase [Calothrix sp. SM1_5_4]|nr:AAA family ATPase [Calothrix sp. SM1_5_4]